MRAARWLIGLALVLGCDDGAPSVDPEQGPDAGDLAVPPDAGPDQAVALDSGPDSGDVEPDAQAPDATPCEPPEPVSSPPPEGLANLPFEEAVAVGDGPGQRQLVATDFEGDGELDFVVAQGGRLVATTSRGALRWQTEVTGVTSVKGVVDLDGDARLEAVAAGPRVLVVHDLLTGARRWTLPDDPLGDLAPPFLTVALVYLTDLDRDGRTDLYVTDGSCTTAGPGYGAVYRFLDGFEAPALTPVLGPRRNGRCTNSQSLTDWDGDGQVDLLLNDADGLNLFDLQTGERRLCGQIPGVIDGRLPHVSADLLPEVEGLEAVVIRGDGVRLVALDPSPRANCPDQPSLRPRWHRAVAAREDTLRLADVDDDGRLDVLFSYPGPDGWMTEALSAVDGAVIAEAPGWALRGRLDGPDGVGFLVAEDPDSAGPVQRIRLSPAGAEPAWPQALPSAQVITLRAAPTQPALSSRLSTGLALRAEGGLRALAQVDGDGDGLWDGLTLLGSDGVLAEQPLLSPPTAINVTCDPQRCQALDVLYVATTAGRVLVFDSELAPRVPLSDAATLRGGQLRAVAAPGPQPMVVVRTPANQLGAVALDNAKQPFIWQRLLGRAFAVERRPRVLPVEGQAATIAVDAGRYGDTAWIGLDAETGEERWRNALAAPPVRRADATAARANDGWRFVRMDSAAAGSAPFAECPAPLTASQAGIADDLESVDPRCPDRGLTLRLVSAWDPLTGACLWQTWLRPVAQCTPRSNERVSAADADGDGVDELHLTESLGLVQLDLLTGALRHRSNTAEDPGRSSGGGVVVATGQAEVPLVLTGSNGPIEGRAADLEELWSAAWPADQDARDWLYRGALVVGDEVWASPRSGYALGRYALNNQSPAEPLGRLALQGGARIEPASDQAEYAQLDSVAWVPPPGPAADPVLLATADEPWLYALTAAGTLSWSRPLPALPGPPLALDVDQDDLNELVIPLNSGQILLGDEAALGGPPAVLDRDCEQGRLCRPDDARDEDALPWSTALCAAWVRVAEADGYEVRAVTENGAALTDWQPVAEPHAELSQLPLVPGARYRVQVRAVAEVDGVAVRSQAVTSDGVDMVEDEPPQLSLTADPARAAIDVPVALTVLAQDNDRIPTRRLEVLSMDGTLQWRAEFDQRVLVRWDETFRWDGRDLDGAFLAPGTYVARVTVSDRAGNREVREVVLERLAP